MPATPPMTIAYVVEGHGEVPGLPKLLYRIAQQFSIWDLRVPSPFRIPRGTLVAPGGIERAVDAQARRVEGRGGVLVVLDADDDCPAHLGPSLLARARAVRPDKEISVVLPNREFEAWSPKSAASRPGGIRQGAVYRTSRLLAARFRLPSRTQHVLADLP